MPLREWSGSIEDLSLLKAAPEFILSAKEFENIWFAWKLPGSPPEVDFSTDLAAVQTTQGSKLRLSAALDDRGNLTVLGLATLDLHPGFRYVFLVLSRKGVKTINGKELTTKADQTYLVTGSTQDRADFGVSAGAETQSVKNNDLRLVSCAIANEMLHNIELHEANHQVQATLLQRV
jgi:hypothetical protein